MDNETKMLRNIELKKEISSTQNLKANSSVGESEFGLAHFSRGPHHGNRGEPNINNQRVQCTLYNVQCILYMITRTLLKT